MLSPITPYERFTLHEALSKMDATFATLVTNLAPLPPESTKIRGLFECMDRRNEQKQRAKHDKDLGIN